MHTDIDCENEDLWIYHDPGDRRRVMNVLSFSYYALSPSTESMVLYPHPTNPMRGEVRVYGPEGQFVWYEVQDNCSEYVTKMLQGLFVEFKNSNRLKVA